MKTIVARIVVILAMILLGVFLFISGKEHAVFIENKGEKYTPKKAYYILDGKKEVKITIDEIAKLVDCDPEQLTIVK
jgi:hypothetical protein